MRKLLTRLTTLRAAYSSAVERQQAWRLLLINLAWIVAIILAAPLMLWWVSEVPDLNIGLLFVPLTVIVAILIHLLIQRGQLRQARGLFVLNMLAVALLTIFPEYRLDSPFVITLVLPLTAAGVLLRGSRLLWIALGVSLAAGVGGLAQIAVGLEPTRLGGDAASIGAGIVLVLVVIALNTVMLWTFTSSAEDVFDRQHSLSDLIAHMAEISQTVTDLPGMGEELNRVVEQLRDALGLYHVQIFLTDPASDLPVLQASTGFIGRRLLEGGGLASPDERGPVSAAIHQKDPILIQGTDPQERRASFLPATQSELLLPLRVGNLIPLGVLDLHSTRPDAFAPEERDILVMISSQLAAAIHSFQQANMLRSSLEERDQLNDQIEAASRELTRLNRQLVSSTWGAYLKEHQQAEPGLSWRAGSRNLAPSVSAEESEVLMETIRDGEARLEQRQDSSVLCVPIRLRDQTLGAVEFRRSSSTQWTAAALELAQVVAERLALSLENARLFEQAQTTAQREQLVSQISGKLTGTTDIDQILQTAIRELGLALGASQTMIRLATGEKDSSQPAESTSP
jgi:GAF domain-containing protein